MAQQNTRKFNVVANVGLAELSTEDDVICQMLVSILLSTSIELLVFRFFFSPSHFNNTFIYCYTVIHGLLHRYTRSAYNLLPYCYMIHALTVNGMNESDRYNKFIIIEKQKI